MEPFAFGVGSPPVGLATGLATGILEVPAQGAASDGLPDTRWSIGDCSAASSYAPGMFLSDFPHEVTDDTAMHLSYWPAYAEAPQTNDVMLSDGGNSFPFLSLLHFRCPLQFLFLPPAYTFFF